MCQRYELTHAGRQGCNMAPTGRCKPSAVLIKHTYDTSVYDEREEDLSMCQCHELAHTVKIMK